jgi:DNA-binding GntR family transcriptional regulator
LTWNQEDTSMTALDDLIAETRDAMEGGNLLSDRVYRVLRTAILAGELSPGTRVVESDLARKLGVSQAPVRDAVKRLAHETLVTAIPRRGHYVTEISAEQADQARQLRRVLEEFAARHAAERRAEGYEDQLRKTIEGMREAAEADDSIAFRDSDMAFHRLVAEASGNDFLPRIWQVLEPSLHALRVVSDPTYAGNRDGLVREHERLLDLLLDGKVDDAADAFRRHGFEPLDDDDES